MKIICIHTSVFQKYIYIIDNLEGMIYLIVDLYCYNIWIILSGIG